MYLCLHNLVVRKLQSNKLTLSARILNTQQVDVIRINSQKLKATRKRNKNELIVEKGIVLSINVHQ